MSVIHDICCHLLALVRHHAGHKPRITDEALASLTLYPARRVKAEPQTKPPVRITPCPCGDPAPAGFPPCCPNKPCSYAVGRIEHLWNTEERA